MSVAIAGAGSAIAKAFEELIPDERVVRARAPELPVTADRYLFCAGFLRGERIEAQGDPELDLAWRVNFAEAAQACERILAANPEARICIIGSESGIKGSFDMAYAGAKAALHLYVERRKLEHPGQQLVAISPGIVADAGMTTRRADVENLRKREAAHPKRRFVTSAEVAELAHFLLYRDRGYLSGTVIRMHGGDDAWR